jgi:hypothetical protein
MTADKHRQRHLAVWLWITVALLVGLNAALPRLTLDDGTDYAGDWVRQTAIGDVNMQPFVWFSLFILSIIMLIYLRWRSWRTLWPTLILIVLLAGGLAAVVSLIPVVEVEVPVEEEVADVEREENGLETGDWLPPVDTFVEVDPFETPPSWIGLVVSVVLAFFALSILGSFYWYYVNMVAPPLGPEDLEEPLAGMVKPAQTALDGLRQGRPLADVVMRCYADMEQALRTTQGIERRQAVTVREFERQLLQLGLPAEAVTTLTRLFEAVRYGRYAPQPEDQTLAIDSLTQIVAASEVD